MTEPAPAPHGPIFALTGPSGVGKTTLSRLLLHRFPSFTSHVPILTTRGPREGDDGEYRYVAREKFDALLQRDVLAACANIPSREENRSYGYLRSDIERTWREGKLPIVITEMQLLRQLASSFGRQSILSCGLLPPGESRRTMLDHLLHRLQRRGRDSPDSIADRLANAERDLDFFLESPHLFDAFLVNDGLATAFGTLTQHLRGILPHDFFV